jgi:hypothetical protein
VAFSLADSRTVLLIAKGLQHPAVEKRGDEVDGFE